MHELSIAVSLVEIASEEAARHGAEAVDTVFLKVGALSGVVCDALTFSFDVATAGTLLEGARLAIETVPVVAFCTRCETEKQLPDGHTFLCPDCDTPTPEIRQGRELEMTGLEIR